MTIRLRLARLERISTARSAGDDVVTWLKQHRLEARRARAPIARLQGVDPCAVLEERYRHVADQLPDISSIQELVAWARAGFPPAPG